jgi:hypothetical protein
VARPMFLTSVPQELRAVRPLWWQALLRLLRKFNGKLTEGLIGKRFGGGSGNWTGHRVRAVKTGPRGPTERLSGATRVVRGPTSKASAIEYHLAPLSAFLVRR